MVHIVYENIDSFYPKFFLICFLQFFFIKCSNNFFTIKITNNIWPWNSTFNIFNHKYFFRPIWTISFSKNNFAFSNSNMITNFEFSIFIINFFTKVNICIMFNINRLHFNCSMTCIVLICTMSFSLPIYVFFWHRCHIFVNIIL